jgi:hypothetical protein
MMLTISEVSPPISAPDLKPAAKSPIFWGFGRLETCLGLVGSKKPGKTGLESNGNVDRWNSSCYIK